MYLWKSDAGKDGRALLGSINSSLEKAPTCSYVMNFWPVLMHHWNWRKAEMRQGAKWEQEATSGYWVMGSRQLLLPTLVGDVESMEGGENNNQRKQKGTQRFLDDITSRPLATCPPKIEASPETFGRMPMTLSSEFREEFLVENAWNQGWMTVLTAGNMI